MADVKIAGALLKAGEDAVASENFHVVSATVCLWTILELPYVFKSYDCSHAIDDLTETVARS